MIGDQTRIKTIIPVALVATLAVWASASEAQAQQQRLPKLNIQQFRPAPGPADYLTVYGTGLTPHLDWNMGLYANFADAPLEIPSTTTNDAEVIDFQLGADLIAAFGLFGIAEVGLTIPSILSQASEDLTPLIGAQSTEQPTSAALGDIRLSTKFEIINLFDGFGLGFVNVLVLPTGDETSLAGDGSFGTDNRLLGEYALRGGVRIGGNLGIRYRADGRAVREAWVGNEFLWGVATTIPLWEERLDVISEVNGAAALGKGPLPSYDERSFPAEFLLGLRVAVSERWTLSGGAGTRLVKGYGSPESRIYLGLTGRWVTGGKWNWDYDFDGFVGEDDKCPREPEDRDGFKDEDGCPDPDNDGDGIPDVRDKCPEAGDAEPYSTGPDGCPDGDIDGDGIPDEDDKCPEDPEDTDGFQDADGCPDFDNDDDGILDRQDSCPDTPETINGVADEDGCPEREGQKVIVTNQKLEILDKVYFQPGSARMSERSVPVLEDIVRAMRENPDIKRLRIEGHTDNQGRDAYNLRLSQKRAEAVRAWLIERGEVAPERLVAVGYGETQPIDTNDTNEGRGRNRRVDFVIIERDAAKAKDDRLPDDF